MTRRPLAFRHRARDPGVRLAGLGGPTWVHCPRCNAAAKSDSRGVACASCGYMTIQHREPWSDRWARFASRSQLCSHCRKPLEDRQYPTARAQDGKLFVRVQCPNCQQTVDYPARPGWSPQARPAQRWLPLFLVTQVAGQTLWVDNLAHLEALEDWLGASVRERGPVVGLTMMARLPRWMKAAGNRAKVLRGLAQLRERAEKAGIDE